MVADPVKAPALEKNDTGETVQFQFRHKVHVLKIRIPKNDLSEKVSEITRISAAISNNDIPMPRRRSPTATTR